MIVILIASIVANNSQPESSKRNITVINKNILFFIVHWIKRSQNKNQINIGHNIPLSKLIIHPNKKVVNKSFLVQKSINEMIVTIEPTSIYNT